MKFNRKISRFFIFASAALLLVLLAQPAPAVVKQWVGPNPNTLWTTANNWSPAVPPGPSDIVHLTSTTNKTASYNTTSNPPLSALTVDATGGGTFTLSMPGNTLSVANIENIGLNGKGQVVQSGGTNNCGGDLILGNNSGSSGTYTLSGSGSLSTNSYQFIGYDGTGLFNQTGGNNTVGSILYIGASPGGVGTYNLNGGHLQAPDETVGNQGTGTFTQSTNGTNIVSDTLTLGDTASGTGTYTMKGGYLQTNDEIIGDHGKGTFTQQGGTHQVISQLILGNAAIGNGTFTLLAGGLSAGNEDIGGFGTGQFIQSGGTNTVANDFVLATDTAASSGAYTLNAGQLQAHRELIGNDGTGVFTQNGGTNTAGTSNTAGNDLTLGANSIGNGTYNLVKGTLSVAHNENIGNNGTGTFNQTGGTHTVTNILAVAAGTGSGTYNLQGGTLSAKFMNIFGGGTFNVKNTTTTVTGEVSNFGGTIKTTNANVTWTDIFVNSGAYISDLSTQTFNRNLDVTPTTGYLVGGSQDVFIVKNDFFNFSTQNTLWNTVLSSLKFVTGADNSHNLYVPGVDNGPHGQAYNFTWGTLNLTGQKLILFDAFSATSTAFYAEAVIGATFSGLTLTNITNSDTDPINIYYNAHLAANAYLHGLDYTILGGGGGMLIAHTPVPPSVLLLGSGLLGQCALGWRRKKVKS